MGNWSKLKADEKVRVIKFARLNGVSDIKTIRDTFNMYADGGDTGTYNKFVETLPDNMKHTDTAKYDMYRYWELNGRPKDFEEAKKREMFHKESDGYYHASTLAEVTNSPDKHYGTLEFIKAKNHSTIGLEVGAYLKDKNHPMRNKEYILDYTEDKARYRPRTYAESILPEGAYVGNIPITALYANGGNLTHKKSGEERGESSMLLTSVPGYLAAQKQSYTEPKPVDSFLGTDYVHNFIQKNKDAMLPGGDWRVNSPAYRIDLAYMRQADKGSYILGVDYLDLVNKLHGKNASSGEYFQSFSTVTPKYFPNKTSYQYLYNTPEMGGYYYKSYLPSIGWHEYAYSTGGPLYPFSFEKNPYIKTPVVRYDEGGQTYTVKKGDTFSLIALNVGVSVLDLQKLNPTITNVNKIREGLSINIPVYMFSEIFNTPQFTGLSIPQVLRTQPLQQQNTPILSVEVPIQKGLKTAGPLDLQELAVRQAYTESRLRPEVVNDKGAYGLFQIMLPALDDYNRVNKTNYTLEDMKDADNNIKVRNWYMEYLSNLGFIDKGDIQSDSVGMYKVLASFNAGAGNVKDALTRAKADGKDIYDSWDWVSYLWGEPREYADFILRGIETKGTNKNEFDYKAISTAKSGTANKIRSSVKL